MAARKKSTRKTGTRKKATRRKAPARKAAKRRATRKKPSVGSTADAAGEQVFPEVEALVELMERHQLLELEYRVSPDGGRDIRLARLGAASAGAPVVSAAPAPAVAAPAAEAAPAAPADPDLHAFKSPMVGTFYRATSPEASPFMSVGDTVEEATTVCIIEAMKVMNEITPDARGEIVSIEVENGEAVEFGQTLFLMRLL